MVKSVVTRHTGGTAGRKKWGETSLFRCGGVKQASVSFKKEIMVKH